MQCVCSDAVPADDFVERGFSGVPAMAARHLVSGVWLPGCLRRQFYMRSLQNPNLPMIATNHLLCEYVVLSEYSLL